MLTERKDDLATAAAIGLLAYLTADVSHHVLGHGAACLSAGGKITALSSIFVDCTLKSAPIDLAGPLANSLVGAVMLIAAILGRRVWSRPTHLFLLLAAAFNLFWATLQMIFSVATRTDDWAWPIHYYGAPDLARYGLIVLGIAGYWLIKKTIGARLDFSSRHRARLIVITAWLAGGAIACLTAAFDRHPFAAIFTRAAPQSLLLSIGIPFLPTALLPSSTPEGGNAVIDRSWYWIGAATLASALSVVFLGPGFAVSL